MVSFIAGGKGVGKTKKLIDMANDKAKVTQGHLVYIDDDKRHIFDLNYDIRFVETGKRLLSNYRELIGFIQGVLSMDNDIEVVYIDGLTNIIQNVDNESLLKLTARLEAISAQESVDFVLCVNYEKDIFPETLKGLLI